MHTDVGGDAGGNDDEARFLRVDGGVVPNIEVEERDVGGGDADAAEEGHAHGLLHPGEEKRGQRPHRFPDQHILGEGQALLRDHHGDVSLVSAAGGHRHGGGEKEGEEEMEGMVMEWSHWWLGENGRSNKQGDEGWGRPERKAPSSKLGSSLELGSAR